MMQFIPRRSPVPDDSDQPLLPDRPDWFQHLLRLRGITTPQEAAAFLNPDLSQLHDPFAMQDMDRAVALIRQTVEAGERIMVYGDYDCDGVCAASILVETLRRMGALVDYHLPSRHQDGYGLNTNAMERFAPTHRLLITVDCGITNVGEVQRARELGMKVIVTDHHQLGSELPKADAVLNPLLGDYPFRRLCGAGVALKLCQALQGLEGALLVMDLAAVATVGDLVPLLGENRAIVAAGLRRLNESPRPFLHTWLGEGPSLREIDSACLAYRIVPRINAAGRMGDARRGVEMLLADGEQAAAYAKELEEANTQRKELEQQVIHAAQEALRAEGTQDRCILVKGEGWNSGVIGLAAGRLCERHHLPAIVLTQHGDTVVGSCRSIPGINIHQLLSESKDLFQRFGGHEMAAGLTMAADNVAELKRRLGEQLAAIAQRSPECFTPAMTYDAALKLEDVSFDLLDNLKALEPTGYGNPSPVFLLQDAAPEDPRAIGAEGRHLMMRLRQGDTVVSAMAFSMGERACVLPSRVDCLFVPEKNEFNGRVSLRLLIRGIIPHQVAPTRDNGLWALPLLKEISWLMSNHHTGLSGEVPKKKALPVSRPGSLNKWLEGGKPVLAIAHDPETVKQFQDQYPHATAAVEAYPGSPAGGVVLTAMDMRRIQRGWAHVVLLDGNLLPGEAEALQKACPGAKVHAMAENAWLKERLSRLAVEKGDLRNLFLTLEQAPEEKTVWAWSEGNGYGRDVIWASLYSLQEIGLLTLTADPLEIRVMPRMPVEPDQGARLYLKTFQSPGRHETS